jgi:hypothetical protein
MRNSIYVHQVRYCGYEVATKELNSHPTLITVFVKDCKILVDHKEGKYRNRN